MMELAQVTALFTQKDGRYFFARWGRPIVPVVFGVQDETLAIIKGAIEAMVTLAGHKMAETDAELGANLMMFFCRSWQEVQQLPHLADLLPEMAGLWDRLAREGANQYRFLRFDEKGAIKAAFVFVVMDAALRDMPADILALKQALLVICSWSNAVQQMPLFVDGGLLSPDMAALVRAAYDPVMPAVSHDSAHALRLTARLGGHHG